MAEILLLGAFGQRNVGDEALCRALCETLSDHDVVVATSDPDQTAAMHHCRAIPGNATSVARALQRADVVVVGGGTIFKPLHPASGRRPLSLLLNTSALLAAARLRHVPIALLGVGAADLHGNLLRRLARQIATRADLLVLRDEESAAVLTDAGVEPPFWIGADPAWLLFGNGSPSRPLSIGHEGVRRRRVTVAVSHLAGDTRQERALAGALARLSGEGWAVRLQLWQAGSDDLGVAQRLAARVPGAMVVPPPDDLQSAAADFADDDLVVAMRFHAIVAAGAARRRIVAIAHEPKLAGLARRLDQIAVPPDATASVIDTAVDWALAHDPPSSGAVARQIELARQTVQLLRVLIAPADVEHPEDVPALQLSNGEGRW